MTGHIKLTASPTHLILMNFRHGTVFRTHVSVSGSMSSTMTKGASSRVTMLRWLSSGSQSEKDLYLGHTACLRLRVWFSHLPTCIIKTKTGLCFLVLLTSGKTSLSPKEEQKKNPSTLRVFPLSTSTYISASMLRKMGTKREHSVWILSRLIKSWGFYLSTNSSRGP